jgi:NRAMP (natural resistance-associated macrophage protein)-like metal ion transporter
MPEALSVREAADTARAGARRAARRVRLPVLRLRERFRGRAGIVAFLAVMGPGLIAGMAGNDAGGITTYTVVGATTGLTLLWLFPVMVVILAVVQDMVARLGVVTGQGLSDLIRDRFGVRWTAFAMLVLLVANLANTVAEFAGVSAAGSVLGIPPLLAVPASAILVWALVLFASRRMVERVFLATVVVFALYILSAVIAQPDWADVGRALVTPTLPTDPATLLLVVALVGTTITPFMQFYLQSAVAEKGIDEEELGLERADAVFGAIWTNTIAAFIVIAVAGTLFVNGIEVESAADAAQALAPVAGPFASVIFAVGLFGASMLAATILPVTTAFVICEAFGWESGVGKRFRDAPAFFGIFTALVVLGALVVLIPGLDPIPVIIGAQYLQGLLLPIVLVFIVLLVNDRRLMGDRVNGRWLNLLTWACVGLVVLLDLVLLASAAGSALG